MGPVQGNSVAVNVVGRTIEDGRIRLILDRIYDDKNNDFSEDRFEYGKYITTIDGQEFTFDVIFNGNDHQLGNRKVSYIEVDRRLDDLLPPAPGRGRVVDDDVVPDGNDIVDPPASANLIDALKEAFIVPVITNDNGNVQFKPNTSLQAGVRNAAQLKDIYDWDDADKNSKEYWAVYLLGAFQYEPRHDADPDREKAVLYAIDIQNRGEATFFYEAISEKEDRVFVEYQHEFPNTGLLLYEELVVQAVGHVLASFTSNNTPLEDELHQGSTRFPQDFYRYTDYYLDRIRSNSRPGWPF